MMRRSFILCPLRGQLAFQTHGSSLNVQRADRRLRERQARADGGAASRWRVDIEISSCEGDALLHAEQALASSLNGALARGGHIEAATVIAHHELQGAVGLAELDLDEARLRVTDDI